MKQTKNIQITESNGVMRYEGFMVYTASGNITAYEQHLTNDFRVFATLQLDTECGRFFISSGDVDRYHGTLSQMGHVSIEYIVWGNHRLITSVTGVRDAR